MKYILQRQTPSYLCDRSDRMHPWAMIRSCQEVTEYHGNSTGIGFQTLVAQNRAWVITRSFYHINRRPNAFEPIMLQTWSRGIDGLYAFRDYLILDSDGNHLLAGTSYWTMIDFEQRRVVRLNETLCNYPFVPEQATDRSRLDKIQVLPSVELNECMTLEVRYSMLDHTGHVNNSEYVKWIFDCVDLDKIDINGPFDIELNFQHETKLGEVVKVMTMGGIDNRYQFVVKNESGVSVVARIDY